MRIWSRIHIFYRVSCHSPSPFSIFSLSHPSIIWRTGGWRKTRLDPGKLVSHPENCPRHGAWSGLPRNTWLMWGQQIVTLEASWVITRAVWCETLGNSNPAESVCLFGSWLCLDNFNVSWISRQSVWWMVQDSVLLVVKRVTQDFQLIY